MNPFCSIRRWRCSRGYGVHSPFAFRFIRNVLQRNGEYYSSAEIDRMPAASWLGLLFRLVCEFEPTIVQGLATTSERKAVSLADSRTKIIPKTHNPAIPSIFRDLTDAVLMLSDETDIAVFRDIRLHRKEWELAMSALHYGMTFSNGRQGVIVMRYDLPRQDFDINF